MPSSVRVFSIGLNAATPQSIHQGEMRVLGVARIDFLSALSLNPANTLFALLYQANAYSLPSILRVILHGLFLLTQPLLTYPYKHYRSYLHWIQRYSIRIVNLEDREALYSFLHTYPIDLFVVNVWSILPKEIINLPPKGTVIIHPSKLPQLKGALPTLWALKQKVVSTAVTYLLASEAIDGGQIIAQHELVLEPNEDWLSLEKKIEKLTQKKLYHDLLRYCTGKLQPTEQRGESSTTGKYEVYRGIDWGHERAGDIVNKINLYPFLDPLTYCFTKLGAKTIYFKRARIAPRLAKNPLPGEGVIRGINLLIGTVDQPIVLSLFKDISIAGSLYIVTTLSSKKLFG